MKRTIIISILSGFIFVFNLMAALPQPASYDHYNIPKIAFDGGRANFTWDWVGPEGGTFWRVVVDPQNSDLAFALSEGGDLWRTVDGNSWLVVPNFMYQHPNFALYTSQNHALIAIDSLIYNTTDGGNNWTQNTQSFIDILSLIHI